MSTTKGRPLKRARSKPPPSLTLQNLPCTVRKFLTSTAENMDLILNEDLILSRLSIVSSNGNKRIVRSLDSIIFPTNEQLLLDNKVIQLNFKDNTVVVAWCKPKNMVIDASDGQPFRAVLDTIESKMNNVKLHPIGQLDKNTTGLFLFTNCGNTSNYINLPGNVQKTYEVTYIAGANRGPTTEQIQLLTETGIDVSRRSDKDTHKCIVKCHSFKLLSVSKYGGTTPQYPNAPQKFAYKVEISIDSGANHIVKRVIAASNLPPVKELKRIRIGNISLKHISSNVQTNEGGIIDTIGNEIYCLNKVERNDLCSEKKLIHLKLCQLLCKYRTLKLQHNESPHGDYNYTIDDQDKEKSQELNRMEHFLKLNFRITGPCYENSQLKCRGGVKHNVPGK